MHLNMALLGMRARRGVFPQLLALASLVALPDPVGAGINCDVMFAPGVEKRPYKLLVYTTEGDQSFRDEVSATVREKVEEYGRNLKKAAAVAKKPDFLAFVCSHEMESTTLMAADLEQLWETNAVLIAVWRRPQDDLNVVHVAIPHYDYQRKVGATAQRQDVQFTVNYPWASQVTNAERRWLKMVEKDNAPYLAFVALGLGLDYFAKREWVAAKATLCDARHRLNQNSSADRTPTNPRNELHGLIDKTLKQIDASAKAAGIDLSSSPAVRAMCI